MSEATHYVRTAPKPQCSVIQKETCNIYAKGLLRLMLLYLFFYHNSPKMYSEDATTFPIAQVFQ